jgi:hypothetical protein
MQLTWQRKARRPSSRQVKLFWVRPQSAQKSCSPKPILGLHSDRCGMFAWRPEDSLDTEIAKSAQVSNLILSRSNAGQLSTISEPLFV